ncbi:hypothetical protein [Anaerosporobacter sp.]
MRQKNLIHKIAVITVLTIMTFNMVACSSKKGEGGREDTAGNKGRFIEKEVTLPELDDGEKILQISSNDEGSLRIYSIVYKDDHKKADIYQYDLKENQTFEKNKTEWLQNLDIDNFDPEQAIQYIFDRGKTKYAYFSVITDGIYNNRIYKTTDGKTGEILPVKEWEKSKDKDQVYVTIGVTSSGNLYLQDADNLCRYDEDSKSFVSVLDTQQYDNNSLIVGGDKIVLLKTGNKEADKIEYNVWNEDKLEEEPQTFNLEPTYDVYGFVNENNDIMTVDHTGIHQLIDGTSAVQLVIDGSMNMMNAVSSFPKQIIQDKEANYYVLYYLIEENKYAVMSYIYDSEVSAIPETTLTVYSLTNDLWTKEAATVFQREHPNVKVELRVAMDEDSTATREDYIRQLNTELLNGEGPDVLVMDGLPKDSYISKGTLLDIRDVIQPLVDQGELFENMGAFYKQEDGSYYTFPVNIKIPLILSHKEATNYATSLEGIVEYVKKYNDPMGFGSQSWETLMQHFLPVYLNQLISHNEADEDKIENFLTKLIVIFQLGEYDTLKEESVDDYFNYYFSCKVTEGLQMAYEEGTGFYDIGLPSGLVKYIGGDISVLNQTFYPVSSLSINKNSKNIDLAKEFITCLLSVKMQENDMQTGFPVNKKAFENRKNDKEKQQDRQWTWDTIDENGKTVKVPYGWPDDRTIDLLELMCENVYNEGNQNQYMLDVFIANSQDYADGKIDAHEAAQAIVDKLQMYLKE